jgi:hypothetical protein
MCQHDFSSQHKGNIRLYAATYFPISMNIYPRENSSFSNQLPPSSVSFILLLPISYAYNSLLRPSTVMALL